MRARADEAGLRVALVVSRYHDFVTRRLRDGAMAALEEAGVSGPAVEIFEVAGAYELPQAARAAADTRRFDAVICLGCVIRGETPHFEYIASAAALGVMQAALQTRVPITFGVLTTNSAEEALARAGAGPANKGREAAAAALDLARLFRRLGGRDE
ncbi:MAG TPA: 6,7-dimethyl-8-ribityllumazine synthase [Vicinamibacterales bacterium]|nr:6,7-dimethyl-8-ribityllumazine synthase [Vicinamibacterales bacterium]